MNGATKNKPRVERIRRSQEEATVFLKMQPESWEEVRNLVQELTAGAPLGWAFREHAKEPYRLILTLQRAAKDYTYPCEELPERGTNASGVD